MRKSTKVLLGAMGFALALTGMVMADKDHRKKGHHDMACPMKIEGAQVRVDEIETGVVIHITSDSPDVVKKIQIAASQMLKHHAAASPEKKGTHQKGEAVYRSEERRVGKECRSRWS